MLPTPKTLETYEEKTAYQAKVAHVEMVNIRWAHRTNLRTRKTTLLELLSCRVSGPGYKEASLWYEPWAPNPLHDTYKKELRGRNHHGGTDKDKNVKIAMLQLLIRTAANTKWDDLPEITCSIPRNTAVVCKVQGKKGHIKRNNNCRLRHIRMNIPNGIKPHRLIIKTVPSTPNTIHISTYNLLQVRGTTARTNKGRLWKPETPPFRQFRATTGCGHSRYAIPKDPTGMEENQLDIFVPQPGPDGQLRRGPGQGRPTNSGEGPIPYDTHTVVTLQTAVLCHPREGPNPEQSCVRYAFIQKLQEWSLHPKYVGLAYIYLDEQVGKKCENIDNANEKIH